MAPLDWGMGHATRCIPIIRELISRGFEVLAGAEKLSAVLLQKEFPDLKILPLKGYRISYSETEAFFAVKMVSQFPKILAAIKYEHTWLQKAIADYDLDVIISDNRYGMHSKKAFCIFITHQLFIKTGNRYAEWLAQRINYNYINKFNECWVPDEEGNTNLAGVLSHPKKMPDAPVKYIGVLSRFEKYPKEKSVDLAAVLSGPEPQRTIFENILLSQMKTLDTKMVLVRGLPSADANSQTINNNLTVIDYLPAAELNDLLLSAKTVIARSGYSTVMDFAMLQCHAILVPTPGQTEQEYLANYLSAKNYCIISPQGDLNIKNALDKIKRADLIPYPELENNLLQAAIIGLL